MQLTAIAIRESIARNFSELSYVFYRLFWCSGAMRIHFQPESDEQVPVAANINAELDRLPA